MRYCRYVVVVFAAAGCLGTIKGDRKEAQRYLRQGLVYRRAGNYVEAARNFAAACRADPSCARAKYELGVEYLRGDVKRREAAALFQEALALDPQLWEARYFLVDALKRLGNTEEAIEEQKILVSQRPRRPEVYNNLGDLLLQAKRFAEAEKAFREALSRRKEYGLAWGGLGVALWRQGKLTEGIEALRKAVTLLPRTVPFRLELARALTGAGRGEEARREAQEAASLEPENGLVYHVLAEAELSLGNKDQARLYAREALVRGCPLSAELRDGLQITPEELQGGRNQ